MQLFSADATICFKRNVYNPFVIFCWVLIGKNNASILKKITCIFSSFLQSELLKIILKYNYFYSFYFRYLSSFATVEH